MTTPTSRAPDSPAPGFLQGVLVAFIAALAGTLAQGALTLALPPGTALRLTVAALAGGYLLYLLGASRERIGKIPTLALWLTGATLALALAPALWLYLTLHAGMIWIVRSLYFPRGLPGALADLLLTGLGLVAAIGAYRHTASLFLSLWCLFLVLALFAFLPASARHRTRDVGDGEDRFARAHRAAEAAIRRLASMQ